MTDQSSSEENSSAAAAASFLTASCHLAQLRRVVPSCRCTSAAKLSADSASSGSPPLLRQADLLDLRTGGQCRYTVTMNHFTNLSMYEYI